MEELVALVRALLRRVMRRSTSVESIQATDYNLDRLARSVTLRGRKIDLTAKEFLLVEALFTNLGKIISMDILAMAAWG